MTRLSVIPSLIVLTAIVIQLSAAGQQSKQVAVAPIPIQVSSAKKLFVVNAGGDERFQEEPFFSGGTDRAYNQFYAGLKASGRYDLVTAPADADVLVEIRFIIVPLVHVANGNSIFPAQYDPQFRLEIRDDTRGGQAALSFGKAQVLRNEV